MATFSDLKKRFITSTFAIIVLVLLLVFAYFPYLDWVLLIAVSGVTFLSCYEWIHLAKGKNLILPDQLLPALALGQVFSIYLAVKLSFPLAPIFFFFLSLFILFMAHFRRIHGALSEIAVSQLHLLYLALPLGLILWILYGPTGQDGRLWTAYLLVVTKITDIAAYFGGKLLGRRKLAPVISPKKTKEGAIIGFLFAVIASVIFSFFSQEGVFDLSFLKAVILGIILGIFAQLGDLSESLLKRDVHIKDSSSLPGLGGIMDTLDSLQWNILIIFFYLL